MVTQDTLNVLFQVRILILLLIYIIEAKIKKIILNKDDYDNQQNHQIP